MAKKKKSRLISAKTTDKPFLHNREQIWVVLLCIFAGFRLFMFSAAFPFFSNVDELYHFDLVIKYAHGHVPEKMEKLNKESVDMIVLYGSPEYMTPYNPFSDIKIASPLWRLTDKAEYSVRKRNLSTLLGNTINHEDTQPPVYYFAAAIWHRLGKLLGLSGGLSLYWIRFMNIPIYVLFLWFSFYCIKNLFPGNTYLKYGVAVILAVFPQDVMYTINNDVLSPLLFTLAFYFLIRLYQDEGRSYAFHLLTGFSVACTFLNKFSNVSILLFFGVMVVLRIRKIAKLKMLGSELPKVGTTVLTAILPIMFWLTRNYFILGDITGSAEKIRLLGWTSKSFHEIWSHPIFSLNGILTFWHDLLACFWRGELVWHQIRLASGFFDAFYSVSSFLFVALFIVFFASSQSKEVSSDRFVFSQSLLITSLSIAFLALVSLSFDFNNCWYPSRHYPYMTSGRLILGMLLPFLILYLSGLDSILSKLKISAVRESIVAIIGLSIMISEILMYYPVFKSPYNLFHMMMHP